jgi:hypothetical protein
LEEIKTTQDFGKMKPYTDTVESKTTTVRVFDENIDPIELLWHRDLQDRKVTVIEGSGWYFQKENEIPLELCKGTVIFIERKEWHRVIKGTDSLKILIEE